MPERNEEKSIELTNKNIKCSDPCDNLRIGQNIEILIGDVLLYSELIVEENIDEIKECICDGCKYYIIK